MVLMPGYMVMRHSGTRSLSDSSRQASSGNSFNRFNVANMAKLALSLEDDELLFLQKVILTTLGSFCLVYFD